MPTIIKAADLIESVASALQFISYYHPADYIAHLARAYEREESPAAKDLSISSLQGDMTTRVLLITASSPALPTT